MKNIRLHDWREDEVMEEVVMLMIAVVDIILFP